MTSDAALILRARGGDELAFRRLLNGVEPFIRTKAVQYFLPGGEPADLYQEGLFGLHKAVRDFKPGGSSFRAFARLCIERQIFTAITAARRGKHAPLNESVSMHQPLPGYRESDAITYADCTAFADPNADPANNGDAADDLSVITRVVRSRLTPLEQTAVIGFAEGTPYEQIAQDNDVDCKVIDNALQRGRRKIAKALEAAA